MMGPTLTITCLSRALSPLTHQSGTVGNESVLNDEPVRTPLGVRRIPILSGNAIRHRMVRFPAAQFLVESWGLDGALTKDELNLLFHGGLRRESGRGVSLSKLADMERLFPMLRLLGACLPEEIYSGSLCARRGILVCRENAGRIRSLVTSSWDCPEIDQLAPASTFVGRWQYVRGEARKSTPIKPSDSSAIDARVNGSQTEMMPFAGTCVVPGAEFLHGFTVQNSDTITTGCLLHSLRSWAASGGTIGGHSSRGHGILETSILGHVPSESVDAYVAHVRSSREEGVAMLRSMYAAPAKRPTKGAAACS